MSWRNYRHRFVPWVAVNWTTRSVQKIDRETLNKKQDLALKQLLIILTELDHTLPSMTHKSLHKLIKNKQEYNLLKFQANETIFKTCGYQLAVKPSQLPNGGKGVFVIKGTALKGQVVALYPGTVYLPFDPILLQSINNEFILRCIDGIHIDGKHRGLSKIIYKSCALRDTRGSQLTCDLSWLTLNPLNPLAIGQLVNNHTTSTPSNIEYIEIKIPTEWPVNINKFIPNVYYLPHLDSSHICRSLRGVVLLATRDIQVNEELYSSYITMATQ